MRRHLFWWEEDIPNEHKLHRRALEPAAHMSDNDRFIRLRREAAFDSTLQAKRNKTALLLMQVLVARGCEHRGDSTEHIALPRNRNSLNTCSCWSPTTCRDKSKQAAQHMRRMHGVDGTQGRPFACGAPSNTPSFLLAFQDLCK
jgi:hypothetical protein